MILFFFFFFIDHKSHQGFPWSSSGIIIMRSIIDTDVFNSVQLKVIGTSILSICTVVYNITESRNKDLALISTIDLL